MSAFSAFLDPVALLIVLGGTALAAILRTPAADLARGLGALGTLGRRTFDARALLDQIATLARVAQRQGVVTLDRSIIRDPDVALAITAIVDGEGPTIVEQSLTDRRRARVLRHAAAVDFWSGVAEAAPAMGMIGTLIGLVRTFADLRDPTAIGQAMAIALLATLYGALVANLVAMPICVRLRRAARTEAAEREKLVAPLVALAQREQPRTKLTSVA